MRVRLGGLCCVDNTGREEVVKSCNREKLLITTSFLFAECGLQRRIYSHSSNSQIVLGGFPRVPSGKEEAVPV